MEILLSRAKTPRKEALMLYRYIVTVCILSLLLGGQVVRADGSDGGKGDHADHPRVLGPEAPPSPDASPAPAPSASPACPPPPAVGSSGSTTKPPEYDQADYFAQQIYDELAKNKVREVWFRAQGLWLTAGKDLGKDAFTKEWVLKLKLGQAPTGKWMVVSDYNPKPPKGYEYRYVETVFDLREVRVLYYCGVPVVVAKCGNPMGPYTENVTAPPSGLDMIPSSASGKEKVVAEVERPKAKRRKSCAPKKKNLDVDVDVVFVEED